jgi:PmbA protein
MTDTPDLDRLKSIASDLVAKARRAGADAADVVVVRGTALAVEVRDGKVEETERSEADDLSLRVFVGRRFATVSTNAPSEAAALVERAVAMARHAPEDPYAGLAAAADLAREFPDLDLVDAVVPTADALTEAALAAEAAMRAVPGVSRSGGASASWSLGGMVLATSDGFSGAYLGSRHGRSATAVAGEGTGMERDYWSASTTHLEDLADPAEVGRLAGERAARRLSPRRVETQTATVVYEPRAAGSLVRALAGAANGAAIARGTSFLKEKRGERVFAPGIRITDDPTRRRGLASRPFDGEGVSGRPMALVEDGVLAEWLLDGATARELGLSSNGRAARGGGSPSPSATNLTLEPGRIGPKQLLAQVGTGLYVTDLIGHGANLVTGDYSLGAAGFWIENGELGPAVSEITIAGNLNEMFARLVAADDLEYRYATNAPTIAVEGMTIAGR